MTPLGIPYWLHFTLLVAMIVAYWIIAAMICVGAYRARDACEMKRTTLIMFGVLACIGLIVLFCNVRCSPEPEPAKVNGPLTAGDSLGQQIHAKKGGALDGVPDESLIDELTRRGWEGSLSKHE